MRETEAILQQARGHAQRLIPELMARIDWPRQRLDEHRERSLRAALGYAFEHSGWHRERLGGIDLGTFRIEDIPSLPTMTKADLMSAFDRISTDARVTLERCSEHVERGDLLMDGAFAVFVSGGTSGVRAVGVERLDALAEAWASAMPRFVRRWAARTGAFAGAPSTAGVGAAPGPHASHILGRLFGGEGRAGFSVVDPMDAIVDGLNRHRPDHLVVYASFVPRLLDEARKGRLLIRPKLLSPVAEPLLSEHEEAVAEVWGSTIITTWGATEVTGLAASSGFEPGMLLLDDLQVVEPVDAEGRPVPPGQRADKVLVTPLRSRVLPLIRYEITDQLTVLDEPAACGSSFTRVSNVEGRLDEGFVYEGDVAVHPHVFRTVMGRHRAITEYQVAQTERGATVRVVLATGAGDLDRNRIIQELRDLLTPQGLRDAAITVDVVVEIPRSVNSQKLRRFVPLQHGPVSPLGSGIDA